MQSGRMIHAGWIVGLVMALQGCSASVENDIDDEETGRIEQPVWGSIESTDQGTRAAVCIPQGDACLRLSVVINSQDRIGPEVTGEIVERGCAPDAEAITTVTTFHGTAFTGHGTLWLEGDTAFADGTSLPLNIEAAMGDCR